MIWEVQWASKGGKSSDKGEGLVSISSNFNVLRIKQKLGDGRIVEWSMKKGLEKTELMTLKRTQNPGSKENSSGGINFR